jgi:hypothetical protein
VRGDPVSPALQRSMCAGVISCSASSPNAGRRCASSVERYERSVDGLQARSCST